MGDKGKSGPENSFKIFVHIKLDPLFNMFNRLKKPNQNYPSEKKMLLMFFIPQIF